MNSVIDISFLNLAIGFALMVIPIVVFLHYKVKLIKATVIGTVRMAVQLILVGMYLEYIFKLNSAFFNVGWVLVMAFVSSFTIIQRSGLRFKLFFLPILMSIIVSIVLIDTYILLVIIKLDNVFDARYFIPITGMLLGSMIKDSIIFLGSYYKKIHSEQDLYRWYLGNGANRKESLISFTQHAFKTVFNPLIATLTIVGLISLPGMMTGQILGGSNPNVAVKYQIVLMITIFVSSVLNIVFLIWSTRRIAFDDYGNLKGNIFRKEKG
jgi:putative ABC transport system permease protein